MEVFFSPIRIENNENVKFKSCKNFAFIKFYDLNILCDCPLVCKNDLNLESNQELSKQLSLDKLHDDTLFPATFLFNEYHDKKIEKIEIDLILVSNPYGLTGVPFLTHYNDYCNSPNYRDFKNTDNSNTNCKKKREPSEIDYITESEHSSDEEYLKSKYWSIHQWLDHYPSKFEIKYSKLLITPMVYQSGTIYLQQLIEYYTDYRFNNILDPFLRIKTSDIYGIFSSKIFEDDACIDTKDSLKTRHAILSCLTENGPEYFYNKSNSATETKGPQKHNKSKSIFDYKSRNKGPIVPTSVTSSLNAAIYGAIHIFDGNIYQNTPTSIGCNTSNSSTSHPPLLGRATGNELSFYPRSLIDRQLWNYKCIDFEDTNNNSNSDENITFKIQLMNIGQVFHAFKNFSKFSIHPFNSGFSLGSIGFHISAINFDFEPKKTTESLTIIGPTSLEFDRYPAPLYLGDLLNSNNLVFYGGFINKKLETTDHFSLEKKEKTQPSLLPIVKIKEIDQELNIKSEPVTNHQEKPRTETLNYQDQLDNIIQHIYDTLNNHGSALIPVDGYGLLCLEVIEFIGQKISELSMPYQVPMYVVGGGIPTIFINSDICGEWTSPSRTRKVLLPNPKPPFIFSFLKKSNRLYAFHTIGELSTVYREPAIFFATNSNLKFGPSCDLFRMLNNNPNNSLIIIDSFIDFDKFIKDFKKKPILKVIHSPVYIEPNIYKLIENIIPYFNQCEEKFNFIIPNNNDSESILYNDPFIRDDNYLNFGKYIKFIPITNKIVFNSKNKIFGITGDWIPATIFAHLLDDIEDMQINPNLSVAKLKSSFKLKHDILLIEQETHSDDLESDSSENDSESDKPDDSKPDYHHSNIKTQQESECESDSENESESELESESESESESELESESENESDLAMECGYEFGSGSEYESDYERKQKLNKKRKHRLDHKHDLINKSKQKQEPEHEQEPKPKLEQEPEHVCFVDDINDLFDDFSDLYFNMDEQPLLFGKITLKSLINELKNKKLDEISITYDDNFCDEKVISVSIQSIECKIIIFSSNNFMINSSNHKSRELVYDIISSLLVSA
ncbi:hypothetical protein OIY81_816 [Cryptosporidium canis]|nr:hypothetical protein OIY81_816 [Cryptosporidium canis]